MRFSPISEEEAKAATKGKILKPGICDFEIKQASEHVGPKGVSLKLLLKLWDADNDEGTAFDYLTDAMPHKPRHMMYAIGLGHVYEQGDDIDPDMLIGKSGQCLIRTEQDKSGQYGPKNGIVDYLLSETSKAATNYKATKARDNGETNTHSVGPSPRQKAWDEFRKQNEDKEAGDIESAWRKFIKELYPNVVNSADLTPANWVNVLAVLKNGPAKSTISANVEFNDSDIPFAPNVM